MYLPILLQENTKCFTQTTSSVNADTTSTTERSVELVSNGSSVTASGDKEITRPAAESPRPSSPPTSKSYNGIFTSDNSSTTGSCMYSCLYVCLYVCICMHIFSSEDCGKDLASVQLLQEQLQVDIIILISKNQVLQILYLKHHAQLLLFNSYTTIPTPQPS